MIAIDLYFEFLPHWAGPMIYENLIKASKYFNFNIINYYIYPHFIRILTDLQENYEYIHIIVEKTIPNQENFLDNLSLKLKNNQEIIVDNNFYKIVKKYYCIKDFIKDIVDYSLKINTSYPKNIFWSNVGNYIAPRPFTGYGYSLKNQPTIIEGHCFPMEKYFDFSWNNLLNYEEKLHRLYQYTKEFHHLINKEEEINLINCYYNPQPLILDFENYNLPEEIIISCLKNHNNGYYFQGKAIVFMDFKDNKNIPLIIQGYQDTINIRMAETAYYYEIDKNRNEHFWINGLKNIMVFEDKIHMGHKKHTMDKILKYLFKIQNIDYNEDFLDELTNYLWDLNSKIVQEFNELQGFISSTLIKKNEVKNIIYNFYKKQYNDPVTKTLAIAHNLYDSMMILGLGGIMTPHKDPYNLKGVIDQWLKLLMDNKITINFSDLIKIFEEDYQEKFFWKNTINGIHSRWILMFNYIPKYLNSDKIGHEISQEIHYFNEIKNKQYLLKRLTGLLKKNHDEDEENKEYHSLDDELNSYINELYSYDNYEKSYQWLLKYEDFLLNYLDNVRIKGNDFRENLIKKIIHWKFYE